MFGSSSNSRNGTASARTGTSISRTGSASTCTGTIHASTVAGTAIARIGSASTGAGTAIARIGSACTRTGNTSTSTQYHQYHNTTATITTSSCLSLLMCDSLAKLASTTGRALESIWDDVGVSHEERLAQLADLVEIMAQLCEPKVRKEVQ